MRQEVRRLGQFWTKGQTGSKCTQERMTASTAEKPKKRVVGSVRTRINAWKTGNDYNTPSPTASMVQHGMGM